MPVKKTFIRSGNSQSFLTQEARIARLATHINKADCMQQRKDTKRWVSELKGLGHAESLRTESVLSVIAHVSFLFDSIVSCMSRCA